MATSHPAVCVFCGSSFGNDPKFAEAARAIGAGLAEMGAALIYGGGSPGLMGEVARAAQAAGAPIQGILPAFLQSLESSAPISPEERLIAVVHGLLDGIHAYHDAHQVMLAGFPILPEDQRETLRYNLRTLAYRMVGPLEGVLPDLVVRRDMRAPLVQSLFGMASHAPSWLREQGPLSRLDYAAMIARGMVEAGRATLAG